MTDWPAVPAEEGAAALETQLAGLAGQIGASRCDLG
jgi:hypothetical protein